MQEGLLIDGRWGGTDCRFPVNNKYSGETIAEVSEASLDDVDAALSAAERAAPVMAKLSSFERSQILLKTVELLRSRKEEIAKLISLESGKALKFSRVEVDRACDTFTYAAEEAKRVHGETVPLDASESGRGYFGFWVRRPLGVVVAITPFNFPLNLVAHKVAPAIAAGNATVLKPAELTPLTGALLCELLIEAGLPAGAINLIQGPGETVGDALVRDRRVAKITFTGSPDTARIITSHAGLKRVTLELGNTGPVIVSEDADLDLVASKCALGAFYNSGQVCVSVQRIYAVPSVIEELTERFVEKTKQLVVGDPLDDVTDVGPMIQQQEAERIEQWVNEAKQSGARALIGDRREGAVYWPTILCDVNASMKVMRNEVFAPVASIIPCDNFDEALTQADQTDYGLQASVFTRDIDRMLNAIERLNFGGIIVNDTPNFRADHMPYGGNRISGIGREGLRYAVEEMTNIQMVAIRRGI